MSGRDPSRCHEVNDDRRWVSPPLVAPERGRLHMSTPELLSPVETAAILHIHRDTLYRLRAAGRIGFVTLGAGVTKPRIYFTRADIDAYLTSAHRGAIAPRR